MLLLTVLGLAFFCSVVPAVLFCVNLRRYKQPPDVGEHEGEQAHIAVLIPARNEEANIEACLRSVLASRDVELDVLVMDDASTDRTAEIVSAIGAEDARVRLLQGVALPPGWNGKQFACWQLAQAAQSSGASLLVFLDADVRLQPEAIARMAAFQRESGVALVSGFPRQITVTFLEWLLLPLIHFVLLAFLPMGRMRKSTLPAFAAGCGQFLMVERGAYFASGGHAGIRETMHDGLRLPRLLREHGYGTDLADLTELASVRMYSSASEVWSGLAKNATEGLAAPGRIVPLTVLLLFGQVVPVFYALFWACVYGWEFATTARTGGVARSGWCGLVTWVVVVACLGSFLPRMLAVHRFRQPLKSALLHPVGMLVLLALQWHAFVRKVRGRPVGWRARTYGPGESSGSSG